MKQFAVRDLYESFVHQFSDTPAGRRTANKAFTAKVMSLVESKKIKRSEFSFKELYEALVVSQDLEENLGSSAFPNITSQILSSAVIDGYENYPKEGLGLVQVVPSKMKVELSAGWTPLGVIREVREKEDYLEVVPPDEKTVSTVNKKYGGKLSLTKEDIFFDKTGQLVVRAGQIGEEGARWQDQLIMQGILDVNSNVYNKGQLYSAGNSNLLTGAATALGTAAFETVDVALMNKTDAQGRYIWVKGDRPVMIVPPALNPMAFKLKNNEYGPAGTALGNDKNYAFNKFDIIVTPYQTTTTRWHYGSFKRNFRWFEVWPLQTFSRLGQDTEDGFNKDIIQQLKVSMFGGIGAMDTPYAYQMNGV